MGDQRNRGNVATHHALLREQQVVQQVRVGPVDARRLHLTWWTHHQEQLHQSQQPALPPVIHGAEPGISPTELKSQLTVTNIQVLHSVKWKRKAGTQEKAVRDNITNWAIAQMVRMKLMKGGYCLLIALKLGVNQSSWFSISCLAWIWYNVGPVLFGLRVKKHLVSCPQRLQEGEGVRLRRGGWACDYTGVRRGAVEQGPTSQHLTWPTPGKLLTPLWASRPSEYRSRGPCPEN